MTLATQTLEVIGLRRKDADTITVEMGVVQTGPTGGPMIPFGSHMIDVAEADIPELGDEVTLTFSVPA